MKIIWGFVKVIGYALAILAGVSLLHAQLQFDLIEPFAALLQYCQGLRDSAFSPSSDMGVALSGSLTDALILTVLYLAAVLASQMGVGAKAGFSVLGAALIAFLVYCGVNASDGGCTPFASLMPAPLFAPAVILAVSGILAPAIYRVALVWAQHSGARDGDKLASLERSHDGAISLSNTLWATLGFVIALIAVNVGFASV